MISFDHGSLRTTLANFRGTAQQQKALAAEALRQQGGALHEAVVRQITMTDHTQADLDELDNPYARRHKSGIQIHNSGGDGWITPAQSRVHRQTGTLLRSLRSRPIPGVLGWRIEFDTAVAAHAVDVVDGTERMYGRDVIWDTANGQKTRKAMMTAVVRVMGKMFRTKASIKFGKK